MRYVLIIFIGIALSLVWGVSMAIVGDAAGMPRSTTLAAQVYGYLSIMAITIIVAIRKS